ncbi:MAG: IS66 family transposase [Bacteroidales bacterium]
MLYLLRESIHKRKSLEIELIDVGDIKERMDKLLEEDISHLHPKMQTFQKSLTKYKEYLFQFLENILVPSDNNASERGVRPLKIKQKVSGMFKTDNGADAFCQLHSIVDTAKKKQMEPFLALIDVAKNCLAI